MVIPNISSIVGFGVSYSPGWRPSAAAAVWKSTQRAYADWVSKDAVPWNLGAVVPAKVCR